MSAVGSFKDFICKGNPSESKNERIQMQNYTVKVRNEPNKSRDSMSIMNGSSTKQLYPDSNESLFGTDFGGKLNCKQNKFF